MKRSFIYAVIIASILVFSGCGGGSSSGGGGGSSSNGGTDSTTSTASGTAQLGYISGGTVNIYSLDNLTKAIATTTSSTSINTDEAGSFSFADISLSSSTYYSCRNFRWTRY